MNNKVISRLALLLAISMVFAIDSSQNSLRTPSIEVAISETIKRETTTTAEDTHNNNETRHIILESKQPQLFKSTIY